MSEENLYNQEAKEKIKALAENIDFAMMATDLRTLPFHMVPMSTKKVDEKGNLWFLSGRDSTHNQHIAKDSKLQLVYADKESMQFMTIYGNAYITNDSRVIKDLYGKSDDAWFDGVDDPNVTAIQVRPAEAFYWDPHSNKIVTMFKIGVAALKGDEPDLMDFGRAKV